MKNLVIGIGEALWDILPDGKKIGGIIRKSKCSRVSK